MGQNVPLKLATDESRRVVQGAWRIGLKVPCCSGWAAAGLCVFHEFQRSFKVGEMNIDGRESQVAAIIDPV